VERAVGEVMEADKLPVLLGGEHSVTIGALQAAKRRYPNFSVLQFDAHADLRDSYQGTRYSHACVGRRACELAGLTQVGIRSMCAEEAEFRKSSSVKTFFAADLANNDIPAGKIFSGLEENLYITIDLDVFDPSIMPATGTPEPGGLSWYTVLAILREACRKHKIIGFDVVELCPMPYNVAPDFLASKLIYRMLGYIFYGYLKAVA
jgi:agmatinase